MDQQNDVTNDAVNVPVIHSMGRIHMTLSQLNMSWTVAPAKARRNSLRWPAWPTDTIVFVTDVPMLAPMMIKMA